MVNQGRTRNSEYEHLVFECEADRTRLVKRLRELEDENERLRAENRRLKDRLEDRTDAKKQFADKRPSFVKTPHIW